MPSIPLPSRVEEALEATKIYRDAATMMEFLDTTIVNVALSSMMGKRPASGDGRQVVQLCQDGALERVAPTVFCQCIEAVWVFYQRAADDLARRSLFLRDPISPLTRGRWI